MTSSGLGRRASAVVGLGLLLPGGCGTGAAPAQERAMNEAMSSPTPAYLPLLDYLELKPEEVSESMVRSQNQLSAPAPAVTAELSLSRISITAKLANPTPKPMVLYLMPVGYGDSPFAAYLMASREIHPAVREGAGPSVLARCFRVTIPPRTAVRWRDQIDLGEFTYAGEPEGIIAWFLRYANHETREGKLTIRLPRR